MYSSAMQNDALMHREVLQGYILMMPQPIIFASLQTDWISYTASRIYIYFNNNE